MTTTSIVNDRLLDKVETAKVLNCSVALINKWVHYGKSGPQHVKIGSRVYFRESELNRWIAERTRISSHRKPEPVAA